MRVILVGNTIVPDAVGGLPRYVRELATAIAAAGCETIVFAKRSDERAPSVEDAADGVRIVRHPAPSKRGALFAAAYPLYSIAGVLRSLRRCRAPETVVHAHFPVTALPLVLARIPFLHTFHAPVWRELLDERQQTYVLPAALERPAVGAVRAVERAVVRRAARTFVLSEFMRRQLGALDERAAREAQLIAGGVDVDRFCPDPSVERAGVNEPLLFTARRLTPRTGVDILVAAVPRIVASHPRASLVIAGTGEMEAELRDQAAHLGVGRSVRFVGRVSDRELADWYRRATLVVMPSARLEGFGLTTAEALACGTPVLGTPVGASPELLGPVHPALVAPAGTAGGLAEGIRRLLDDPDCLAVIGERSRARVAPAMGWDVIAARYIDAYRAFLAQRPGSTH